MVKATMRIVIDKALVTEINKIKINKDLAMDRDKIC